MSKSDQLVLLYDGDCAACSNFAEWARRKDSRGRLVAQPSQTPGVLDDCGLTHQQVAEKAWVIDSSGRRLSGAAAVNRLLEELGGPWRVLSRISRLPFMPAIEERVYGWIARHRRAF